MKTHLVLPLLLAVLLPGVLGAQAAPASGPFVFSLPFAAEKWEYRKLRARTVTALATGEFVGAWEVEDTWDNPEGFLRGQGIENRLLDAAGQPGPGKQFRHFDTADPYGGDDGCQVAAATVDGGSVLAYSRDHDGGSDLWVELYGPGGVARRGGGRVRHSEDGVNDSCPAVAAGPAGRYVLAWPEDHYRPLPAKTTFNIQWFDAAGRPLVPPRALDAPLAGDFYSPPAVGLDAVGRTLVVWPGTTVPGLRGQRFRPDGSRLGPSFSIAEDFVPSSYGNQAALAMAPDGSFAVAWAGTPPGGERQLLLRRFAADGTPLGPPVEVAAVKTAGWPVLSADRHGNFVLSWAGKTAWLFNRSLVLQGEPFDTPGPIALADTGRLFSVWIAPSSNKYVAEARGQLWQARHEADLCLYRAHRFLCDTAGLGPVTERIPFGLGPPGAVPLLGDIDGDGRADPCEWRDGEFVCDTAHDGFGGEVQVAFGNRRDTPLLGDIDGDGRADPCVHRGNQFLCDTAHDGGEAEVEIAFGLADDIPLLGDVDGDGRADSCVYRNGRFLCDTAHDGGLAEVKLDLRPVLDGDTSGVPLLGDMEGIGRAEACLYRNETLTCGQFAVTGGLPVTSFTRGTAGQAGDVPMLGDLDAF